MDLRHLPTFLAVARTGTVGQAALALDLAPSSVSEQLKALERAIGADLFVRTPSGMRLTPAGDRLRHLAPSLLEHVDRVRTEVAATGARLTVGTLETLAATHVPALLAALGSRRPDLRLTVKLLNRHQLLSGVADGTLDAALLLDHGDELGSLGFAPVPTGLTHADVDEIPIALVASPDHPLAGRPTVGNADVLAHNLLVSEGQCSYRLLADRITLGQGSRTEVGSIAVIKAWAANGLGMALLPLFAVEEGLSTGTLVALPLRPPPPSLRLRLVWRTTRDDDLDLRAVLYAAC